MGIFCLWIDKNVMNLFFLTKIRYSVFLGKNIFWGAVQAHGQAKTSRSYGACIPKFLSRILCRSSFTGSFLFLRAKCGFSDIRAFCFCIEAVKPLRAFGNNPDLSPQKGCILHLFLSFHLKFSS